MPRTLRQQCRITGCVLIAFLAFGSLTAYAYHNIEVIVNGERLSAETMHALEQTYGVRLQSGRYWYDRFSGLWGLEGGPALGKVLPGLQIGGQLRANASGGNTGVFVNGRELHPADVAYLQRCIAVFRGRYWMNASGVGGEGGPPLFNLALLCQQAQGGQGSVHFPFGTVTQGDGITGFTPPAGTPGGGIGVTCGPDGGCMYSR